MKSVRRASSLAFFLSLVFFYWKNLMAAFQDSLVIFLILLMIDLWITFTRDVPERCYALRAPEKVEPSVEKITQAESIEHIRKLRSERSIPSSEGQPFVLSSKKIIEELRDHDRFLADSWERGCKKVIR